MKHTTTMQDVFEYLRENMYVDAELIEEPQNYESPSYSHIVVRIALTNPETGDREWLG